MQTTGVKVIGPQDAQEGFLGSIGVRFMIDGSEAAERFSLVEHPMTARALAALNDRYGHDMQPESVPELLERFGLRIGEPLAGGWTPPIL